MRDEPCHICHDVNWTASVTFENGQGGHERICGPCLQKEMPSLTLQERELDKQADEKRKKRAK
jgi:hypothetical protein